MLIYLRHAKQTNHRLTDPPIQDVPINLPFNITYDAIITSPYVRTRQTAQKLNIHNKPIYIDFRISEFSFGKRKPFLLDPSSLAWGPVPGPDETWDEFTERVDKHYEYVKTLSGNTLIITHGLVVKYLEEKLTGVTKYARGRDVPHLWGFVVSQD